MCYLWKFITSPLSMTDAAFWGTSTKIICQTTGEYYWGCGVVWIKCFFTAVTSLLMSAFLHSRCLKRDEWKYRMDADRGSIVHLIYRKKAVVNCGGFLGRVHSFVLCCSDCNNLLISILFGSKVEPLFMDQWASQTRWLMAWGSSSSRASDRAGESLCG